MCSYSAHHVAASKSKEIGVLEIIVFVLGIAFCALYAELVALKKRVKDLENN